jgi:copper chaperone NosL
MQSKKLSTISRVVIAVAGISLAAVLYFPIWQIDLNAPQYPEGLSLKIHANAIKGDVAIINGLNHYIGMKTLHTEDFPEFTILPYVIICFAFLFIAAGLINRRRLLYLATILFVLFGIIAMIDFWKWEYNYGHNLDPNAAIVVPGMAYQPPLIGFKQLLNFGAYSIPDTGGWIFLGCGVLLLACTIWEWRRSVKLAGPALALILSAMFPGSCKSGPEPIAIGSDHCTNCKMTIADARFGGEIVTSTGRVYKFDDIKCMADYLKTHPEIKDKSTAYFTDFCGAHTLVSSDRSILLNSPGLKGPMLGNLVAFGNIDSMNAIVKIYGGEKTSWQ